MDTAEELYLKGVYFYVGEFGADLMSVESGYDCIERAANAGHKRAREIMSRLPPHKSKADEKLLISPRAASDAAKLGSKFGFNLLSRYMQNTQLSQLGFTATELREFTNILNNFREQRAKLTLGAALKYEIALRFYVGDMTKRQNMTNGKKWLDMAARDGYAEAQRILRATNTLQRAYVEAAIVYGSVRAIKKVTEWHKAQTLTISDYELIEFAQAVVKVGDVY